MIKFFPCLKGALLGVAIGTVITWPFYGLPEPWLVIEAIAVGTLGGMALYEWLGVK